MNIQDIKQQLSLIETTLKDINGKLMLELLDVMTENRELKEQITKSNQYAYSEEWEEENFSYGGTYETIEINKIEASISNKAEETMLFGIHPVTGKRLPEELGLYAKRHGDENWSNPEESISKDFPGIVLKDRYYHTEGCVLFYDLAKPMKITYHQM